ncbi:MAG: non-canonical purine NTP pyrophosphatase [Bacteroidetes bacterium HGW-Bacteroidetes-1]|jgi:XTP/dITP diphosphohydrolase|nr:MAG: non-canonical purine NTP pyrophosphatase [Bacteroidetes bacterium HGW-Bacteroidetes-1]
MNEIIFATNNKHKIEEMIAITSGKIHLLSLKDIGCVDDIPETSDTIEGNAHLKAKYIHDRFKMDCFADDTGLEVESLGGAPGVYSARYAGENATYQDNVIKLLHDLEGKQNRTARFKTVIAFISGSESKYFEGIIEGKIIEKPRGDSGFGYDPVFVPKGYDQTFAEMSPDLKNTISHRALASRSLTNYLLNKIK